MPAAPETVPERSKGRPWRRFLPLPVVVTLLYVLPRLWRGAEAASVIAYSSFLSKVNSGLVRHVTIGSKEIRGTLVTSDSVGQSTFVTTRVDQPGLVAELRAHGVRFDAESTSSVLEVIFTWIIPTAVFLAIWFYLTRRVMGRQAASVLGIAQSRARVYAEQNTRVTFEEVAGVDEAKAELREIVDFLKDPKRFARLGARMPKGVLLVGPPGTGKTLLARAVAGEAAVPFFSINGSEFVELFVGVGAARVRDLFARARENAPCIIFIDELDALGRARGTTGLSGASDEKEQTLNQLLAELDGFSPEGGVVLLAATNRPEILDPALLRAGRFDRQIVVDRPDRVGRLQILQVHVRRIRLSEDLNMDDVAALTPGFTGADLGNLVNEAALVATRRAAEAVTLNDFTVAIERIVAGLARRSRVLSEGERRVTACHEMGHALVALVTPGADPVQKVSIIPRSIGALGFTMQRPTEDRYIATRMELDGRLTVLLGGRAAEMVALGDLSTGAADDLTRATELAREMVMRQGMDDVVGHAVYGAPDSIFLDGRGVSSRTRGYSDETAREIDVAVRSLLNQAFQRAMAILTLNRSALEEGTKKLIERETLTRAELPAVRNLDRAQPQAA